MILHTVRKREKKVVREVGLCQNQVGGQGASHNMFAVSHVENLPRVFIIELCATVHVKLLSLSAVLLPK
jgi:hypothetical protein